MEQNLEILLKTEQLVTEVTHSVADVGVLVARDPSKEYIKVKDVPQVLQ
jgi:hypothetical protein